MAKNSFYNIIYTAEPICARPGSETPPPEEAEALPAPLRAARALEVGHRLFYQDRRSLFLTQAKLLEHYEDDYPGGCTASHYFPTYDVLSDRQLRSYFAWRTQVRRGDIQPGCASFAYLYLYELINQIGTGTPVEGLKKMDAFVDAYSKFNAYLLTYYGNWRKSYIVYYNLSDSFLRENERESQDEYFAVLDSAPEQSDESIAAAVKALAPSWLGRSKFYRDNQADMDRVMARVLRQMHKHYASRSKRSFSEQLFGSRVLAPFELFYMAVFCDPLKHEDGRYYISDSHYFECSGGCWAENCHYVDGPKKRKLENLTKSIDAALRQALGGNPIQAPGQLKWVSAVIAEETAALLEEKKQAEQAARKIAIDYSALERIRRDAAVTRERLAVEDELEPEAPPSAPVAAPAAPPKPESAPEAPAEGCPLSPAEYRLMQNLLYGGDRSWVQREGMLQSVLLDSINEKLYDSFQDSVVEDDRVVEDYIDELKEMVKP